MKNDKNDFEEFCARSANGDFDGAGAPDGLGKQGGFGAPDGSCAHDRFGGFGDMASFGFDGFDEPFEDWGGENAGNAASNANSAGNENASGDANGADKKLERRFAEITRFVRLRRMRERSRRGPAADATQGQGRVLAMLRIQDGISTKDLSYLLGIRVSSLNETLTKLEKSGFVERVQSESDKRVMLVKLTEKGRANTSENNGGQNGQNANASSQSRKASLFAVLSDDEKSTLAGILDKLAAALEEGMDDEDKKMLKKMREAHMRLGRRMAGMRGMRGGMAGMRLDAPDMRPGQTAGHSDDTDPRANKTPGHGRYERFRNTTPDMRAMAIFARMFRK
jgi:DNA-binding MarR family transcriptional regulator